MIVSFSGIDSAGKTTQIELLCKDCQEKNIRYKKIWSKARGTPGVMFLKELVRRDKKMNADKKEEYRAEVYANPKKQKLLYIASMLDLCWYWGLYLRILNLTHKLVICDRYLWDSYVEMTQKEFKELNIESSFLWKTVKLLAPKPKVSFMFVIPAEESLRRDHNKNAAGIEELEIKKQKIDCYLGCVEKHCWSHVMDGMKPIDELHREVSEAVEL